ncbi:MAG: LPS export ABC transporter permease LptG [Paracoccaceae bacterium]
MILSLYIGIKYLKSLLWSFLSIAFLVLLIDGSDQLVSMSSQNLSVFLGIKNAFIRSPIHLLEALPLIVMLGSLICFLSLTKNNELIITRSSGRSTLRLLLVPISITLVIGAIGTSVGNPLVAISIKSSEKFLEDLGLRPKNMLSVSSDGIWLRETSDHNQVVVQANRTNSSGTELFDLTLFQFDKEDNLEKRIHATQGRINRDYWELENAKIWSYSSGSITEKAITFTQKSNISVKTNLTQDQILNNFSDPRAINFWSIPDFVRKLEISGFSATRHKLFYQSELSRPFFLVAMMLIGTAFSLRYNRFGQTGLLVLISVLVGFILFSLNRVALSLGEAQQIPIILATHGPPLVGILITLGLLLHLEDG